MLKGYTLLLIFNLPITNATPETVLYLSQTGFVTCRTQQVCLALGCVPVVLLELYWGFM